MKVGIFSPGILPASIKIYIENIKQHLLRLELVEFISVESLSNIPTSVDLIWYPSLAGGRCPQLSILKVNVPVVLTVHGAGNFTISSRELYGDWRQSWKGNANKAISLFSWIYFLKTFNHNLSVITVSEYAKEELVKNLRIPERLITAIHHGYNPEIFKPVTWKRADQPGYLLHVSDYQPKKNIPAIIEAYNGIQKRNKPSLLIIAPGISRNYRSDKIMIIDSHINHAQLALYFQRALAFIFPSLHESFGLPIIEAMASGCPVITSDVTACKEVGGNAALFVNPRSVEQIREAIDRVIRDGILRNVLRLKGLKNVKRFDWEKSAISHYDVFLKTINSKSEYNKSNYEEVTPDHHWNA